MAILASHELITVADGRLDPENSLRLINEISSFTGIIASEITEGFFCNSGDAWIVMARLSDGTFATYIEVLQLDGLIYPRSEMDAINFVCDQLDSSENLMLVLASESRKRNGSAGIPKEIRIRFLRMQRARRLVIQGMEPRPAEIQAILEIQ